MSDFYASQITKARHDELVAEARQDALARSLPRRPGVVARLRAAYARRAARVADVERTARGVAQSYAGPMTHA